MTAAAIALDEWLQVMSEVAGEIATTSLGFPGCEPVGATTQPVDNGSGAYIPVIGTDHSVQLGLIAREEGCQELARALLGMEGDQEILPDEDVADAVGELMNILAGRVKGRMIGRDPSLQIGLPIFIHGHVQSSDVIEWKISDIRLGPVPAQFLVIRSRNAHTCVRGG